MNKRFWEIDFFRGIAIVLMILFNYSFTLRYFSIFNISSSFLYWDIFPRIVAGIFIFLVGVSLSISYSRNRSGKKFLFRGLRIFGYGLIITAVTWIMFPESFIVFGILHLIGISIILAYPFLKRFYLSLAAGFIFILAGIYLSSLVFDFSWLLWLGFIPKYFFTFDYFPLLPWFGLILLGVFSGKNIYPKGKRSFKIKEHSGIFLTRGFCWLGRHSLVIYLVHQPILYAFLYFFML